MTTTTTITPMTIVSQTWGFCEDINGIDLDNDDNNKEDNNKNNNNKDDSDDKGISSLGIAKDLEFLLLIKSQNRQKKIFE